MDPREPYKGRGAPVNPPNRFEKLTSVRDEEWTEPDDPAPTTQFFRDSSRLLITRNTSPDVGFSASLNPYRGCEHGCIYCYARPTHEYLGLSAGLDFESKIIAKMDAPALLRAELSSRRWTPMVLAMSGITDCYQPVERRLRLTRSCLEVLADFRNPVSLITKNALVTRDVDLLQELHRYQAVHVTLSVTSLRLELAQTLEPRTSMPRARLEAIRTLARAGIPVSVNIAPIIPGLNDYEVSAILEAAAEAGATGAGFVIVRLPYSVAPLFEKWLTHHAPESKEKILHRIREIRGGRLNDPRFGSRMTGEGAYAEQIRDMFYIARRKAGFPVDRPALSTAHFRRLAAEPQLDFFEV